MNMIRLYGEDGNFSKIDSETFINSKKNWFIGWKCLAGVQSLSIDENGNIHSADCKSVGSYGRLGNYGNVFTEFKLDRNPINCARRYCSSEFDLAIPKYQRPKFQEVIANQKGEIPQIDKPVALMGDRFISKRIHWDLLFFDQKPLQHWKESIHRLESFFKGEFGQFVFRLHHVPREFEAFCQFVLEEKGHGVILEASESLEMNLSDDILSRVEITHFIPRKEVQPPVPKTAVVPERKSLSGERILLFIPMRNCEHSIAKVVEGLDQEILSYLDEILILDNDSSDQSLRNAQQASKSIKDLKVTVRKNDKNYGFGGSHKLAFQYAYQKKIDYILVVHGDNSGSPKEFLATIKEGRFKSCDAVLSSRLSLGSKRERYPFYRYIGNWALNLLASLMTWSWIEDFSGGPVSLFRVSTFINKFENPVKSFDDRIAFQQDALLYLKYKRGEVNFLPIHYREAGGKSFYSAVTQFMRSTTKILASRF